MFSVSLGGSVVTVAFLNIGKKEKRKVKIGKDEQNSVQVKIVSSTRGKDGKQVYETYETVKVYEASAEQVHKAVMSGLETAAKNSGK